MRDINLASSGASASSICDRPVPAIDDDPLHQPAGGTTGSIVVDGTELTGDLKKIDEVRREVGMVFQHFNLFPHLTIMENCTLAPIWVRRCRRGSRESRCTSSPREIPEQAHKFPASFPAVTAACRDRPRAVH